MKVIIAHEESLIRESLQRLLEDGGAEVVASASCCDDAVRYAKGHKPNVLIADSACSAEINGDLPDETSVVLLASEDAAEAMRAMRDGITSLVTTKEDGEALLGAVESACDGRPYINSRLACQIASFQTEESDLSDREIQVLRLIALGYTNAEVAEELYLSVRTVESHRAHIGQKVSATSRRELVAHARERGLI